MENLHIYPNYKSSTEKLKNNIGMGSQGFSPEERCENICLKLFPNAVMTITQMPHVSPARDGLLCIEHSV